MRTLAAVVLTTGAFSMTCTDSVAPLTSMIRVTSVAEVMPTCTPRCSTSCMLGALARTSKAPGCRLGSRKVPSRWV